MNADKLARMANQIAAFFATDPDPVSASAAVASHLRRFWDPRMRRAIFAWLDETGGPGLSPLALQALQEHRESLLSTTPRNPAPATA
jgi:formate dehydrogenase subunit delta